jgi:hypothetical protein
MLVVNQESKTLAGGDIDCVGISEMTLSMDGEQDITLPNNLFDELKPHLSEPEREHGCIFIYSFTK